MVADSAFPRSLTLLLLAVPWMSCGSTPEASTDPTIEQSFRETEALRLERRAKSQDFQNILLKLEQQLAGFVADTRRDENEQAQRKINARRIWLLTTVRMHRKALRLLLQDQESTRARKIAAAALGFDRDDDDSQITLGALGSALTTESDPGVKTNICFGLGVYGSPLTPTDKLFDLALDTREDIEVRKSAAWALLQIQIAGAHVRGFARTWAQLLEGDPMRANPELVVNALRGLGSLKDPAQLMIVVPYLNATLPFLKNAACIAVGRMENRKGAQYLIPLLGRSERNANVRLHSRKALQALAGEDVDHEYDWQAWMREFNLEGSPESGFKPKKSKRTSQSPRGDSKATG